MSAHPLVAAPRVDARHAHSVVWTHHRDDNALSVNHLTGVCARVPEIDLRVDPSLAWATGALQGGWEAVVRVLYPRGRAEYRAWWPSQDMAKAYAEGVVEALVRVVGP